MGKKPASANALPASVVCDSEYRETLVDGLRHGLIWGAALASVLLVLQFLGLALLHRPGVFA